jgi:hypothetical protein
MSVNPYQSPEIAAEPKDARSARRWVAAPATGIWLGGALYVLFGGLMLGGYVVGGVMLVFLAMSGRMGPLRFDDLLGAIGASLIGMALMAAGWLTTHCARRFYRPDSKHAAIAACLLGVIMYPLCIVTLPLGIWGLIMLRRADVQEELARAERT